MKSMRSSHPAGGFTLIEALVVVTILGFLLAISVPSISDWIVVQRVKASAAELVSDIKFSRGEAIKRNMRVAIDFRSVASIQSCYAVHTRTINRNCNCLQGAGDSCNLAFGSGDAFNNALEELKTVSLASSTKVVMAASRNMNFLPPNGLMEAVPTAFQVDFNGQDSRVLRVVTNAAGRPQICAPSGSRITGYTACG